MKEKPMRAIHELMLASALAAALAPDRDPPTNHAAPQIPPGRPPDEPEASKPEPLPRLRAAS